MLLPWISASTKILRRFEAATTHRRFSVISLLTTASLLLSSSPPSASSFRLDPVTSKYNYSATPLNMMSENNKNTNTNKLDAPAAERNKEPIYEILKNQVLPLAGISNNDDDDKLFRLVEVGGGAGVHLNFFCQQLAKDCPSLKLEYQSCDMEQRYRDSIQCYIDELQQINLLKGISVKPPLKLTLDENGVLEPDTKATLYNNNGPPTRVMLCFNVIHISPWQATLGLMKLAGEILQSGGVLYCYGPYLINGTGVESNL
jgi:hypothetical protein